MARESTIIIAKVTLLAIFLLLLALVFFLLGNMDEFESGNNVCGDNANCENTNGRRICICNQRYIGNGKTCNELPPGWQLYGDVYLMATDAEFKPAEAYDVCEKLVPQWSFLFKTNWSKSDPDSTDGLDYLKTFPDGEYLVDRKVGTFGEDTVIGTKDYFKGKEGDFSTIYQQILGIEEAVLFIDNILPGDDDTLRALCMIPRQNGNNQC